MNHSSSSAPDPADSSVDGVVPGPVTRTEELLSAMLDGELDRGELAELEATAVTADASLPDMAAEIASSRSAVASMLETSPTPPAASLRAQHLAASLAAASSPEVTSLAAARTTRSRRPERAQRRFQQIGAIAAGLVVVAGIGLFASQIQTGGTDEAAGSASDNTLAREVASQNESFDNASDDAASDDGAALSGKLDDAFDEGETAAMEIEEPAAANADLAGGVSALRTVQSVSDISPGDLAQFVDDGGILLSPFEVVGDDATNYSFVSPSGGERATETEQVIPLCLISAVESAGSDLLVGIALVELDGTFYEVYQPTEGPTIVLERPDCEPVS